MGIKVQKQQNWTHWLRKKTRSERMIQFCSFYEHRYIYNIFSLSTEWASARTAKGKSHVPKNKLYPNSALINAKINMVLLKLFLIHHTRMIICSLLCVRIKKKQRRWKSKYVLIAEKWKRWKDKSDICKKVFNINHIETWIIVSPNITNCKINLEKTRQVNRKLKVKAYLCTPVKERLEDLQEFLKGILDYHKKVRYIKLEPHTFLFHLNQILVWKEAGKVTRVEFKHKKQFPLFLLRINGFKIKIIINFSQWKIRF